MRYYIIAGEKSGDIHGGNLIQALKKEDPQADIRCWGGECMEKAGGKLVVHYCNLAFMGFVLNLRKIFKYFHRCKKDLLAYQPDVLILIDYGGFNMWMARFAKQHHIKTFYYISPKVWAWNQSRAYKVKAYVDRMFTILPFEKDFYKKYDYEVDFVGNPLVDEVNRHTINPNFLVENKLEGKPVIALLPGSRLQEVKKILPVMLSIVPTFQDYHFAVAAVKNLPAELYKAAERTPGVQVIYEQTYDLLAHAYAAVVTSGTATLETALFEVPQVVGYITGKINYLLSRLFIKLNYVSLVNIVAGKEVVKELLQHDFNTNDLTEELKQLTENVASRSLQIKNYQKIKQMIGNDHASEKTAKLMVKYLKNS
ncbi:MAG: lipid-A-disaccharide synthase [Cytophagales bacterium]|nr:lipid-A-disaccharide synthase [Cytophagales bacterium]